MLTRPGAGPRGLEALIAPRSICVIGASSRPGHFANTPLRNLREFGYAGRVFPVNPKHAEVEGLTCYSSVDELPEAPDLAIVVVPPRAALSAVEQCGRAGVRAAIVVGSGFAETADADGLAMQARLAELSAEFGMRILGPNTLGIANFNDAIVPYVSGNIPGRSQPGSLAIVSQSGGCSFTLYNRAWAAGIGIGHIAVAGNEVDVSIPDLIRAYVAREDVAAVVCYLEAVRDPAGLQAAGLEAARLGKPIFLMRAGTSDRGARAATAHTGALATSDAVFDAALRQWGIGRAQSFDELIAAGALAARFGPADHPRLGVYAQGGGIAVVASDLLSAASIDLAELQPETVEALGALMPDTTPGNPFDSGGQFLSTGAGPLIEALKWLSADSNVDALVCFLMPVLGHRLDVYVSGIESAVVASSKPSVVLQYGAGELTADARTRLLEHGVLVLDPPEAAVRGLGLWCRSAHAAVAAQRAASRLTPAHVAEQARALIAEWAADEVTTAPEYLAAQLIDSYGIEPARQRLLRDSADVESQLDDLQAPYVVKVSSRDIAHRSDIGCVITDVTRPADVAQAIDTVIARARAAHPEAHVVGASVAELLDGEIELIVGGHVDATMGPVVAVGMGGVYAEQWPDTVLALPGMSRDEFERQVRGTVWGPIVDGARGRQPVPLAALHELVRRVGELVEDLADVISTAEMNPVIWSPSRQRLVAADVLIETTAG